MIDETFVAEIDFARSMPSTSNRAREIVHAGANHEPRPRLPLLVLTERQTAGRGRGNHAWWAGEGGLTFSLVLADELRHVPSTDWPKLSIVAALAVLATLETRLSANTLELRWPNDVYAQGRKICGILPELFGQPGEHWLVLGIGLNLNNRRSAAPVELRQRITSLGDLTDRHHDPTATLIDLLNRLQHDLDRLSNADPQLAHEWNHWFRLQGRRVSLDSGGQRYEGLCQGIDPAGQLLLKTATGMRRFHSGTMVRAED